MRAKALYIYLSEPTAYQTTPYGLGLSKQTFVEGNGKNISVKEICKIPEIYRLIFIIDE